MTKPPLSYCDDAPSEPPHPWRCFPGDGCEVVLIWPGKVHP